jgi:hypothetical protein
MFNVAIVNESSTVLYFQFVQEFIVQGDLEKSQIENILVH